MLSIGEARVRFGLFDLLRGLPRPRRVEAEDVEPWLERDADGRGNWRPTWPSSPSAPQAVIDITQIAQR